MLVGTVCVYLTRFLDSSGRRFATMMAARSNAEMQRREWATQRYTDNPDLIPFLVAKHQEMRTFGTGFMLMAIFFLLMAVGLQTTLNGHIHSAFVSGLAFSFLAGGLVSWFSMLWTTRKASGTLLVIFEVERRLMQGRGEAQTAATRS